MTTVGIIAEYNPFHNGHKYQLEEAKRVTGADRCVIIMSGHFVQRGQPALVDKWTRTKMALSSGADLVIELPVHFATSSAEFFSYAAVKLLDDLNMVDYLCFGSEVGDHHILGQIASILCHEPPLFKEKLNEFLSRGDSFVTARANALIHYLTHQENLTLDKDTLTHIIGSPNNILGIEYLKALQKLGSSIKPCTIKRMGEAYHSDDMKATMSSATAIRKSLMMNDNMEHLSHCMPPEALIYLEEALKMQIGPVYYDDYSALLNYRLKNATSDLLESYMDVSEGIENRFKKAISTYQSVSHIIDYTRTRRYPISRIQRTLIHILLGLTKKDFKAFIDEGYAQYIKILGFRKDHGDLLKKVKLNATLPIISNVRNSYEQLPPLAKRMLEDDMKATDIYNIALGNKYGSSVKTDYTQPIIIL